MTLLYSLSTLYFFLNNLWYLIMNKLLILSYVTGIIIIIYLIFRLKKKYRAEIIDPIIIEEQSNLAKTIQSVDKNFIVEVTHDGIIYDFEVELFDKEFPITCKNFRHIAFDGLRGKSYVNSIFHRIIEDFMIQGGDILNNNGTGSVCIYGRHFIDEGFKYSHDRPGLLSMANNGEDTNGSQFFITLGKCTHLDNKHVVFGHIVKGLYNIFKLSKISVDSGNKPVKDAFISKITLAD